MTHNELATKALLTISKQHPVIIIHIYCFNTGECIY